MSFGVALSVDNFMKAAPAPKEEKHRLLGLRPAGSRPTAAPDRQSDPPARHPHDEPASPARFLSSFAPSPLVLLHPPAHHPAAPSNWLSKKARADSAGIHPRMRNRRKRCRKHDFRPAEHYFRLLAAWERVKRPKHSTAFLGDRLRGGVKYRRGIPAWRGDGWHRSLTVSPYPKTHR